MNKTRIGVGLALVVVAGGALMTTLCAVLVHRQEKTLERLRHPGDMPLTTAVYSRWTVLGATEPITDADLLATLQALHYDYRRTAPLKAGQYTTDGDQWNIYVRNFQYPDEAYPAKTIQLTFTNHRLAGLRGQDGSPLNEWRLEPKRLTQWSANDFSLRPQVRLEDLPPYVPGAILAMEDKRFYHHGALDVVGILRAASVDVRHGRLTQGASTISQQLARSIFLDVDRTFKRKVLEAVLAVYLEFRYSKPQLLEMYLNQVYWGKDGSQSLLGIEATSEAYFGTPARELTPANAALLAGLLQSPNRFSPRHSLDVARVRRDVVLRLMQDQHMITPTAYAQAVGSPIRLAPPSEREGQAAYFLSTLQDQLTDRYTWPVLVGQGWQIFTTLDPVMQAGAVEAVKNRVGKKGPQAALVAIDPRSGAVRAWVGGNDFATSPYDRALLAKRQPGSAFKAFVAAAALETKSATTITLLDDSPLTVGSGASRWTPQNSDRKYHGKISLADSLAHSWNVPMVRLALSLGYGPIASVAARAGITSPLRDVPSLALGTSEVSLEEMTSAYGTFAAGGLHYDPYMVEAIVTPDHQTIEAHQAAPREALSAEVSALVTEMLQNVLDTGTARSVRQMDFPWRAAGKTGTSENYQDAWFIGYTPALVCGVWVGYDKPQALDRAAAGIALPVWVRFMRPILTRHPPEDFFVPPTLVWKTVDMDNGLLAVSGCLHRRLVAFLSGTEPTKSCTVHARGLFGFFKRWTGKN